MSVPVEQPLNLGIASKSTDAAEQCDTPGLLWLLWLHGHQRKYMLSSRRWAQKSGYTGKRCTRRKGRRTFPGEGKRSLPCPVMGAACCHLPCQQVQNRMILLRSSGYETIRIRTAPLPPPPPELRIAREQHTEYRLRYQVQSA